MIRKDLKAAREAWIEEAENATERNGRERSFYLAEVDEHGHVIDFHALRMTFITNLTRSGVSPKTAQTLARHSDINLTMGVYTKLGVLDQAAAVESLPPVPHGQRPNEVRDLRATGTDGQTSERRSKKVPTVVPRGAENGAVEAAPRALRMAPDCTESASQGDPSQDEERPKTPAENRTTRASSHAASSNCTVV